MKCQAYRTQLLRERYLLLLDDPRNAPTLEEIHVGDVDIAVRVLDAGDLSGTLPTVLT